MLEEQKEEEEEKEPLARGEVNLGKFCSKIQGEIHSLRSILHDVSGEEPRGGSLGKGGANGSKGAGDLPSFAGAFGEQALLSPLSPLSFNEGEAAKPPPPPTGKGISIGLVRETASIISEIKSEVEEILRGTAKRDKAVNVLSLLERLNDTLNRRQEKPKRELSFGSELMLIEQPSQSPPTRLAKMFLEAKDELEDSTRGFQDFSPGSAPEDERPEGNVDPLDTATQ